MSNKVEQWKQRAEKAETALESKTFSHDEWEQEATAIAKHLGIDVSEPQDGWGQQCIEAIDALRSGKDKAEAACAELRFCLEASMHTDGCTCAECLSWKHALSSDCGKDYIHKSELDKTIEFLKTKCPGMTGYCECGFHKEISRLETLRKESK